MNERLRSVVFALAIVNAGCATTALDPYEKFATAGHNYADSLNNLLVVAQKSAINKSSAELIDQNSFADRNNPNFESQEIARLEKIREIDLARIEVFGDIRKHVIALAQYFTQLNELVVSKEAEETSKAIAATASNIYNLSKKLENQEVFKLTDDQKKEISTVVSYIIASQQRAALKKRIKADQEILQRALNTHEELLAVIGDDLEHELSILNDRTYQMFVEAPFIANRPLSESPSKALKWMEDRRRLMTTISAIGELKSASNAAASLRKALAKLVQDDDDFTTQVGQLMAELEAIKTMIEAFR